MWLLNGWAVCLGCRWYNIDIVRSSRSRNTIIMIRKRSNNVGFGFTTRTTYNEYWSSLQSITNREARDCTWCNLFNCLSCLIYVYTIVLSGKVYDWWKLLFLERSTSFRFDKVSIFKGSKFFELTKVYSVWTIDNIFS